LEGRQPLLLDDVQCALLLVRRQHRRSKTTEQRQAAKSLLLEEPHDFELKFVGKPLRWPIVHLLRHLAPFRGVRQT
jgi:hypothetical protein